MEGQHADGQPLEVWLGEQLRQERQHLETRHWALCEALRAELQIASRALPVAVVYDVLSPEGVVCRADPTLTAMETEQAGFEQDRENPELDGTAANAETPQSHDSPEQAAVWTAVGASTASAASLPSAAARIPPASKKSMFSRQQSFSAVRGAIQKHKNRNPWLIRLERFLASNRFEALFAVLILLNSLCMVVEVQRRGIGLERWLADPTDVLTDDVMPDLKTALTVIENIFGAIFMVELVLKLVALHRYFFCSGWNIFDSVVVVFWFVDVVFGTEAIFNPILLRLCRLVRILRLVRLVREIEMFDTLMLMIASIKSSMSVLLWSVVLLGLMMLLCAMCLNSFLLPVMEDVNEDLEVRRGVFKYFGSFSRCAVTMFEITLGNWVPPCRFLMDNVTEAYAVFFLLYKVSVGFAVIKVISGVFLHETFKCASLDDELMIQTRERARQKFAGKMARFFRDADSSGNGRLSLEEFSSIMQVPRVRTWMQAMDLNVRDPEEIFEYINIKRPEGSEGEGPFKSTSSLERTLELSVEELVVGMNRIRGPAQELDLLLFAKRLKEAREEADIASGAQEERLGTLISAISVAVEQLGRANAPQAATAAAVRPSAEATDGMTARQDTPWLACSI